MAELFLDTANLDEIKTLMEWGIFSGITTNPLIFQNSANGDDLEFYQKLVKLYPIPISIQLPDKNLETLLNLSKTFSSYGPNVVVKVPMFPDGRGIILTSLLEKENIRVNVTGVMSAEQFLLALMASHPPTYISLFFNRIRDGGGDPQREISKSKELVDKLSIKTKIIVGSIRKGSDVYEAVVAGGHIVTVAPKVLFSMVNHPKSVEFIAQSQHALDEVFKKNGRRKKN